MIAALITLILLGACCNLAAQLNQNPERRNRPRRITIKINVIRSGEPKDPALRASSPSPTGQPAQGAKDGIEHWTSKQYREYMHLDG